MRICDVHVVDMQSLTESVNFPFWNSKLKYVSLNETICLKDSRWFEIFDHGTGEWIIIYRFLWHTEIAIAKKVFCRMHFMIRKRKTCFHHHHSSPKHRKKYGLMHVLFNWIMKNNQTFAMFASINTPVSECHFRMSFPNIILKCNFCRVCIVQRMFCITSKELKRKYFRRFLRKGFRKS